ncbi:hypothetical protein GQ55_1G118900 [Panicum hallii var. hallii]|uniref:VQ domain-containing protein n=1 Tax=Panicum hallii var. hallii TaxID=1504633 RepID=A0A2T7F4S0_9POAL|nr:hypothetical protein GQ55_1G118900 [Panicum hallii var. hallii]
MDKQHGGGGVKVTYIETRFVTSDAAGFKDLVQRLTGRSPAGEKPAPAAAPHRPRACPAASGGDWTTAAAAGARAPQGCDDYRPVAEVCFPAVAGRAPPCQDKLLLGMDDFSDLFYVGAGDQWRHGLSGGYSDLPYF